MICSLNYKYIIYIVCYAIDKDYIEKNAGVFQIFG